ncbi:2-iminobutanoate/2-iminopropanoate deaminase [bioreactor metagenome]|uniref:2-iminobutanoate/2-iminopropanoate deaminase n=1 Tax=bioreactor metagenome TaxID=1076179 RepID=A0A644YVR2_9ZZZZ
MQKKIIATTAAPAAIGPYSQAVSANGFLYLSGMLAIDPQTGSLVGEDAPSQAKQILKNISALLASEGLTIENVIKTTVFLTDLSAFGAVNAVYGETFAKNPPARSCVEVSRLPKDALVEIECVAVY